MKKILVALLVLALGIPALAAVDVTWTDLGSGHLQIKVAPTAGAAVRGVALKLTCTDGDAAIQAVTDPKATVTQFNTNIDYAFSHSATYDIGQGHPLAKADEAGELTVFPASTFSLCAGYLDASRAGVVVDSFFDVYYTVSTPTSTITIELDPIRGGIVGDTLGDVNVQSPATLIGVVNYNLTVSSTDGGNVITPGEGVFPYAATTVVNLEAGPADAGYQFTGWTGNVANPNSAITTITMNADEAVIANYALIPETISTPTLAKTTASPAKNTAGTVGDPARVNSGRSETFVASGAASNLGHTPLQYYFTWGDGTNSGWVSSATQTKTYTYAAAATYNVTVKARCSTHTTVESAASANFVCTSETVKSGVTTAEKAVYSAWATFGRPNCWGFRRNCRGDANGLGSGIGANKVWVRSEDLSIFSAAFNKIQTDLLLVNVGGFAGICADNNRAGSGIGVNKVWVRSEDLTTFSSYFNKIQTYVPECTLATYNWYWTN